MINFNAKLIELNKKADEEEQLLEKLKLELQEAEERKARLDELERAEQANYDNLLMNQQAVFLPKFRQLFNRITPFQARFSENKECIEVFIGNRVVARYGKDAINTPFKLLEGEYAEMSKKEDIDLSSVKTQIYNLLEATFR